MHFRERIQNDIKEALRGKYETELMTLRLVWSAILNKEKEKRAKIAGLHPELSSSDLEKQSELGEEELLEVVFSEAKKRRESITEFEKGQRQELADKEKKELAVLQKYLPEQLSIEEIRRMTKEAISKVGAAGLKDIGKVMSELMPRLKGRADGALVGKTVKELLGI